MSNQELTDLVRMYKEFPAPRTGNDLARAFKILLNNLFKAAGVKFWSELKPAELRGIKHRCLLNCFHRTTNYDPAKGKAFNYFTTTMLNFLRQEYLTHKKRQELELQYGAFLKRKKNEN